MKGDYWTESYDNGGTWKYDGDVTVYAHWTPSSYTVTLDRRDGSGGSSSVTATYDSAMPNATMPTRTGYTFGGYFSEVNGGGTQYYKADGTSARTWNIANNTTLYAKWAGKPYGLVVNPNGGKFANLTDPTTVSPSSSGVYMTTGMTHFNTIGRAMRDGYTFMGYYDAATGGTQVYDANGRAVNGTYWNSSDGTARFKGLANASTNTLTVYAHWTENTYNVTLDRQGGSGGTTSVTATYDSAMPNATMPTRTGYTFGGYYTATNGGAQYYTAAGVSARNWNIASNTTLYAKWAGKPYGLVVNPNEGKFANLTAPTTVSPNSSGVYMTTGMTHFNTIGRAMRDGYTFMGYYDAATGGTQVYDANGRAVNGTYWNSSDGTARFKGLANASATVLTVYARWLPNQYPVTFAIYGGTFLNGWTATTNYTLGVGLTLPTATDVSWVDHTFVGWYEDEAFLSDRVTKIGTSEMGNKTFYARWVGKTYTVSFNANGGVGQGTQLLSMTDTEQNQLKTLAELKIKVPDGYTFAAWNTTADGSGDSFEDGAVIYNNLTNVANATVTLYAQWTPNLYEVAFQPNGADGGEVMPNQPFTYDVTQNLDHVAFTYTGHAFEKWSSDTNYNYQTTYYADGAAVANLATGSVKNLYANWTGIVYTVSFDANGGTGTMTNMACTYNVPTNLPYCTFERDGWGFKGWTNRLAEGVLFLDHARVTNLTTQAEEVQMYACWTGVTYAVTLDARDALGRGDGALTNGMSTLTSPYVVGDAWNLPIPTNADTHLSFSGWTYVDTNGVTVTVAESDVVPPPSVFGGATNLVAAWEWEADSLAVAVDAPELSFATRGTVGPQGKYSEPAYDAPWFVQTNYVHDSTNAVQSGALLENGGGAQKFHISWLTTTVSTNGVLTFWWRCSAPNLTLSPEYGDLQGYSFHFGRIEEGGGFTNLTTELTGDSGWRRVVCTNDVAGSVTFAWQFRFTDPAGAATIGGTGWVDRVTWTPEGGATVDVTPNYAVPYSWLRANFPEYASADATALNALGDGDSPIGKEMKVWQDYWAGTNPNDLDDLFRANIAVSNDVARITWSPDLSVTGVPQRVYHVLCAPTPSAGWAVLQSNVVERLEVELPVTDDSGVSTNRFFKVELDWEGSQKKN